MRAACYKTSGYKIKFDCGKSLLDLQWSAAFAVHDFLLPLDTRNVWLEGIDSNFVIVQVPAELANPQRVRMVKHEASD